MSGSLDVSESAHRILIVRLGSMGDIIHTLPAATALRRVFPEAMLGWIVEERWAELLCATSEPRSGPRSARRPIVDKVHTVNTKAWRRELLSLQTWEQVAATISEIRAGEYQLAVDFQGAVRSALLARWSNAPEVVGMRQPRETAASMFYTRQVEISGAHVVEQYLSLAADVAGCPLDLPAVEFPCDAAAEKKVKELLEARGVRDFAVLNPGAGWGAKQWQAEHYGEVAKELARDGVQSLINFGPGEEALAGAAERTSQGAAFPVKLSLPELIALTRRARLFVGGDTGPMHLAAALGVPVVGIFGPTDPARNGPFGRTSIVLRNQLSPTSHKRRTQPDPGLSAITEEEVIAAAQQLLERHL